MPLFLDTLDRPVLAIGICDRCGFKFPIGELMPDPNFPGLRVDRRCVDELDPYRLPPRQTENVSLQFARPDVPIDVNVLALYSPDASIFLMNASGGSWLIP